MAGALSFSAKVRMASNLGRGFRVWWQAHRSGACLLSGRRPSPYDRISVWLSWMFVTWPLVPQSPVQSGGRAQTVANF